jgi:hypothetical protein
MIMIILEGEGVIDNFSLTHTCVCVCVCVYIYILRKMMNKKNFDQIK